MIELIQRLLETNPFYAKMGLMMYGVSVCFMGITLYLFRRYLVEKSKSKEQLIERAGRIEALELQGKNRQAMFQRDLNQVREDSSNQILRSFSSATIGFVIITIISASIATGILYLGT